MTNQSMPQSQQQQIQNLQQQLQQLQQSMQQPTANGYNQQQQFRSNPQGFRQGSQRSNGRGNRGYQGGNFNPRYQQGTNQQTYQQNSSGFNQAQLVQAVVKQVMEAMPGNMQAQPSQNQVGNQRILGNFGQQPLNDNVFMNHTSVGPAAPQNN